MLAHCIHSGSSCRNPANRHNLNLEDSTLNPKDSTNTPESFEQKIWRIYRGVQNRIPILPPIAPEMSDDDKCDGSALACCKSPLVLYDHSLGLTGTALDCDWCKQPLVKTSHYIRMISSKESGFLLPNLLLFFETGSVKKHTVNAQRVGYDWKCQVPTYYKLCCEILEIMVRNFLQVFCEGET